MAVYVLLAESLFATLAALLLTPSLEAGFGSSGGLLEALSAPGAPLLVEGLVPFFFAGLPRWLGALLAVGALHAFVAPLLLGAWLAGLDSGRASGAAGTGLRVYGAALRVRLLLVAPTLLALGALALAVAYAHLVFRAVDERAADLAAALALIVGGLFMTPLRVLTDTAHASLVRTLQEGDTPSARASVAAAIRALSCGGYARWAASAGAGLAVMLVGAACTTRCGDWLAVFAVQLGAYLRYYARGSWLCVALGSLPRRRLGSVTQNMAPPSASSTFAAEMVPP
jgi:hypothetical protein